MSFARKGGLTLAVGTLLLLVGCGGSGSNGHTTNTANTGSDAGTLADLEISPTPGSVYIAKDTTFRLLWTNGTTPPPTFTVTLQRYSEASGAGTTSAQKTVLTREGDTYAWDLSRSDDTTLDSPGVYYLEVDADSEQVLASYIVSAERAEGVDATKAAAVRAATEPGVGDTGFVHTIHLRAVQAQ